MKSNTKKKATKTKVFRIPLNFGVKGFTKNQSPRFNPGTFKVQHKG